MLRKSGKISKSGADKSRSAEDSRASSWDRDFGKGSGYQIDHIEVSALTFSQARRKGRKRVLIQLCGFSSAGIRTKGRKRSWITSLIES